MTKAMPKDTVKKHKTSKLLPCVLTDVELQLAGKNLASTVRDIVKVKDRKSTANAGFKKEMEELQQQQREFSELVNTGIEERQVDCEEVFDYDKNMVRTARIDTGEQLSEREMTAAEREGFKPSEVP